MKDLYFDIRMAITAAIVTFRRMRKLAKMRKDLDTGGL